MPPTAAKSRAASYPLGFVAIGALILSSALAQAETSDASASETANRSHPRPDVHVWIPVDPNLYGPGGTTTKAPRSSASYHVEQACPPGTWRWKADAGTHLVEFDVASALIVRIEPMSAPEAADPREAEARAHAGEEVAGAFRVETGAQTDTGAAITTRFGRNADGLGALQNAWDSSLDAKIEEASAIIDPLLESHPAGELNLTAIVAREHVTATCAPIEVCEGSRWQSRGQRAKASRRTALPPQFFGPVTLGDSDPTSRSAAMKALVDWLREHYVREAAAAAVLADGGDPSAFGSEPSSNVTVR